MRGQGTPKANKTACRESARSNRWSFKASYRWALNRFTSQVSPPDAIFHFSFSQPPETGWASSARRPYSRSRLSRSVSSML